LYAFIVQTNGDNGTVNKNYSQARTPVYNTKQRGVTAEDCLYSLAGWMMSAGKRLLKVELVCALQMPIPAIIALQIRQDMNEDRFGTCESVFFAGMFYHRFLFSACIY
jgi:hypothetical protein